MKYLYKIDYVDGTLNSTNLIYAPSVMDNMLCMDFADVDYHKNLLSTKIRDYFMLNTTDSNYSKIIPVEYPKVGESPSPAKIGVANVSSGQIKWMQINGDPQQHYLTRMEWSGINQLILQQLNEQ